MKEKERKENHLLGLNEIFFLFLFFNKKIAKKENCLKFVRKATDEMIKENDDEMLFNLLRTAKTKKSDVFVYCALMCLQTF